MKIATRIGVFLAAVVGLVIAMVVAGIYTDEELRVRRTATYQQTPEAVWALVSDYERYPEWRSDIDQVDSVKSVGGGPTWVQRSGNRKLTMTQVEATGGRRMVTRTYDSTLSFEGEWIMSIGERAAGTTLTITEKKKRHEPLDRFLSAYVRDPEEHIDGILIDLGLHFGETVEPQEAP